MSEIGKYIVVQKRFQHKHCIKRAIGIRLQRNEFSIAIYKFYIYFELLMQIVSIKSVLHDIKKFS